MKAILEKTKIPFEYDEFKDEEPKLPFGSFLAGDTIPVYADCELVGKIKQWSIELYTREKYESVEMEVENVLALYGIGWEKEENPIPGEEIYQCIYNIETE